MEWVREKKLSENGGEDGPYIKATIPEIVEALIEGFEGSKEYAEIRKNFGATYKNLTNMDSVLTKELNTEYGSSMIGVRGGIGGCETGKIPCPDFKK